MVLEVIVAGQVVIALGGGGALETSNVLLLESEGVPEEREGILLLLLHFWLVTRVKVTSSAFGTLTAISTLGVGVGTETGPYIVLIASTRVGASG